MARKSEINGLPVIDAKHPIKINIGDGDISKASRKEPLDCAVARTCRRQLHAKEVKVHKSRIYIRTNAGSWTRYMVPIGLKAEIIAFDRGGAFSPGEWTLPPPTPSKRLGGQKGSTTNQQRKKKNGKKRQVYHITADVRSDPYGH
jgi:hypothetical protein